MGKPTNNDAEKHAERELKSALRKIDDCERAIGEAEDAAGIPRSSENEPWDIRLSRLRTAT